MKDKYDIEVEYLTEHPEEIQMAWFEDDEHRSHCLFTRVTPSGFDPSDECGCLTQIRRGDFAACDRSLTFAIRADKRIPNDPKKITPADLPVFAEWQRDIDAALDRK